MARQVTLTRIEINADSTVGLLFSKQIVDGDEVLSTENHRGLLDLNGDIAAYLEAVSDDLERMKYPRISADDVSRINGFVEFARQPGL